MFPPSFTRETISFLIAGHQLLVFIIPSLHKTVDARMYIELNGYNTVFLDLI